MTTTPTFGLQFIRVDDQALPVLGANLDVVGIIGPCNTANPEVFPLNTPVLVFSNDTVKLKQLGNDGFIMDAINGINDQLADYQVAAQLVIVRTAYGTQQTENLQLQQTIANIMGSSGAGTGVFAFKKAPNAIYCTPRLIIAPGYTGQMADSLDTLAIDAIGEGYIPNQSYEITFANGAGETNGAQLVLPSGRAVADANGAINASQLFIDTFGAWMTVAPTATLPAPDGPAIDAIAGEGSIVFSANPAVGSKITINGTDVGFVASGATGNHVNIGANLGLTMVALKAFLDASVDANIALATYALAVNNTTLNITNKTAGAAGNGFTLASTVFGTSLSGPTLAGGSNAVAAAQATVTTTIALGANPVCASLTPVLNALMGHAIVESAGISLIDDENWRDTLSSPRLIALSGGVKIQDPVSGDVIVMPYAPRQVGLMIARDFATGFPFHSAANQPIQGIVGPARTISFSLVDGETEGQVLLSANLGIIVRGLIGVETAIAQGGFVSIATDTLASDPLWQFYNVTRGRDYIELSLMPALRNYLGRANISAQTVTNILSTISGFLSDLKALQQIIDFKVNFLGSLNSSAEIRLGHLTVGFQAEEPTVLRLITTMSARYAPAIDAMVSQLESQLNLTA